MKIGEKNYKLNYTISSFRVMKDFGLTISNIEEKLNSEDSLFYVAPLIYAGLSKQARKDISVDDIEEKLSLDILPILEEVRKAIEKTLPKSNKKQSESVGASKKK